MASLKMRTSFSLIAFVATLATPLVGRAQAPAPPPGGSALEAALAGTNTVTDGRWEVTLDGRIGFPAGRLKVGETGAPGTSLRLGDLGIDVSEGLEGSVGFHVTPRDAVRASYLYYFLDGRTTLDRSVVYNGEEFAPGPLRTDVDFYRLSLAYERALLSWPSGEQLISSIGLTYVYFNPTLTSRGHSNSEDFYLQELPVPILGLRWDHPVARHVLLRASAAGGGLPRVDSLRQEGGTVYLQQHHADASAGLVYLAGRHAVLELGYHFTYFFQHEKSHEDNNLFELIDNGVHARFTLYF